jgi:hypothetical protein
VEIEDHLLLLRAELLAATRAPEVAAIAQSSATSKEAVARIAQQFEVTEAQAVKIMDSQFRVATAQARERLESQIRALS